MRKKLTPEFGFPGRGSIELPSLTICMPGENDRIMAHFLRDEVHANVLECLSKQRITSTAE